MYPSRKSSHYSSIGSEQLSVENIEEFDNDTLLTVLEQTRKSNKILTLENELLENYLNHVDPEFMEEFQKQIIALAGRVSSQLVLPKPSQTLSYRHASFRRSTITSSITLLEQGPRLNISTKEEIVTEIIDKLCHVLQKLHKDFYKEQATLRAKIEDAVLSQQETTDAYMLLEKKIGNATPNVKNSRTGENFIEFMEERLRNTDLTMKKLQRRTAILHSMSTQIHHHLKLQVEGESLSLVDFQHMLIENKQLLSSLETKNRQLEELKRISGRYGIMLMKHKQNLKERLNSFAQLKGNFMYKNEQINTLKKQIAGIQDGIGKEAKQLDKIQNMVSNYMCPSVMEYVKKQAEIYELTHNLKIWEHRKHLQQIQLRKYRKLLKILISKHPPSPVEEKKSGRDCNEESM